MRVRKTATQLIGVLKSRKTLVPFVHSQRLSDTFRLNPSLPLIFLARSYTAGVTLKINNKKEQLINKMLLLCS